MALRILHVLRPTDSDAGRSIEAICGLFAVQRRLGHGVEVVTFGSPAGDWLDRLGVPVYRLASGRGGFGLNMPFVKWMRDKAGGYDCVIVHGIWDFCALGTWWALRDATVPFFIFTHGMLDPWFKLNRPFRHLLRWLYWPWGGYPVLRDAHAVFFLSDDERHRAREAFWLYDCHEFVVRIGTRGIPRDLASSAEQDFFSARPELRGKRLFTLFTDNRPTESVAAIAAAIKSLSNEGVWDVQEMRVLVAGSDDGTFKNALERAARRSGIGNCIHWAGPLSEGDKWGALRASEVFLRPCSYEICGNSVAEALSAGTPILMSTGVAIWKDIVNDGAGFADEMTPEGWIRMLRDWISLPSADQVAMRAMARRCFEERYTLVGAAHTLTSAIYLLVGVHRDGRWDLKPLKPASELP